MATDDSSGQQSLMDRLWPPSLERTVTFTISDIAGSLTAFHDAGLKEFNWRLSEIARNGESDLYELAVKELANFGEEYREKITKIQSPECFDRMLAMYKGESQTNNLPPASLSHDSLSLNTFADPQAAAAIHVERIIAKLRCSLLAEQFGEKKKPKWDKGNKLFSFDGQTVKSFSRIGQNQFCVLDAFQELGWPPIMDDPLYGDCDDPVARLNETIRSLNKNQVGPIGIRFSANGRGTGVCWAIEKKEQQHPESP